MPIRTPSFWYQETPSIETMLLKPVSILYSYIHNLNMRRQITRSVNIPVICVGNVTAGGSGKTPTSIALLKLIKELSLARSPAFLSRGYAGAETEPRLIQLHDDASCVGDEPLLLAKYALTVTSPQRYKGACTAIDHGADCVIMDDGLQNNTLHKDITFIVIDGQTGLGNNKILPAGPLREPLETALKRANAVIIIGEDKRNIKKLIPEDMPVFNAQIIAEDHTKIDKNKPYLAFAGLGHPKKFLYTLTQYNIKVADFYPFADHHPYSERDIEHLLQKAKELDSNLITTEKDYVRLSQKYREHILTLPVKLIWKNEEEIKSFLTQAFWSHSKKQDTPHS